MLDYMIKSDAWLKCVVIPCLLIFLLTSIFNVILLKIIISGGSSLLYCFPSFQVLLLGRLHHRNLVNLVGYCAEKGQHMLIYVYMTNGSLASHLYSKFKKVNILLHFNFIHSVLESFLYLKSCSVMTMFSLLVYLDALFHFIQSLLFLSS